MRLLLLVPVLALLAACGAPPKSAEYLNGQNVARTYGKHDVTYCSQMAVLLYPGDTDRSIKQGGDFIGGCQSP